MTKALSKMAGKTNDLEWNVTGASLNTHRFYGERVVRAPDELRLKSRNRVYHSCELAYPALWYGAYYTQAPALTFGAPSGLQTGRRTGPSSPTAEIKTRSGR